MTRGFSPNTQVCSQNYTPMSTDKLKLNDSLDDFMRKVCECAKDNLSTTRIYFIYVNKSKCTDKILTIFAYKNNVILTT